MLTLHSSTPKTVRSYPDQILPGDDVWLKPANGHALQGLARLALEKSLGGEGPFRVVTTNREEAVLTVPGRQTPVTISLSRLTRDQIVTRNTDGGVDGVRLPNLSSSGWLMPMVATR
jgi:hypothetical protein